MQTIEYAYRRFACFGLANAALLLAGWLGAIAADGLQRQTPDALDPRLFLFIKAKEEQARALAKDLNIEVSPDIWKGFELYKNGDWLAASNNHARLMRRNGQYEGARKDPTVTNPVSQPLSEVEMAVEQFACGEPKYARAFGEDIIACIPKGSIFFGGTDPGRGLVTALSRSHIDADPFFILTQNALADENYLIYLRRMYGEKIYIPTQSDSRLCFSNYLADAQRRLLAHKLLPGEDVRIIDNRVQVAGQVAVMGINGLLAKIIIDKNPGREFYIEESYPLEWMYPYLTPHGLVLKIERSTVAQLSEEIVSQDQQYWNHYCARLIGNWLTDDSTIQTISEFADKVYRRHDLSEFKGDPKFVGNDYARRNFSKLRSSLGGLYAWRLQNATSDSERESMLRAADLAFRQALALCPTSPEAVFRYVNLLLGCKRSGDALAVARTCLRLDTENEQVVALVNRLQVFNNAQSELAEVQKNLPRMERQVHENPTNFQAALNLAGAYLRLQRTNWAVEVLDGALNQPKIEAGAVLAIVQAYSQMGNLQKLEAALDRLVKVAPDSPEAWYDLAALKATIGNLPEAIQSLRRAFDLSAKRRTRDPNARDLLAQALKDTRFALLRQLPEFRELIPSK